MKTATAEDKKQVFLNLRSKALSSKPEEYRIRLDEKSRVWGMITDMGVGGGCATLVALIDGGASLYFSSGGGFPGGSDRQDLRLAAMSYARLGERYVSGAKKAAGYPLPSDGEVLFYFLTKDGVYTASAQRKDLIENRNNLSPMFSAANDLITGFKVIASLR